MRDDYDEKPTPFSQYCFPKPSAPNYESNLRSNRRGSNEKQINTTHCQDSWPQCVRLKRAAVEHWCVSCSVSPLLLARHTARSLSLTLSYSASFCTMAETSDRGGSFPTLSPPEVRSVPFGEQPPSPASRAELQHAHLTKNVTWQTKPGLHNTKTQTTTA